jgi:hypothetical protein
VGIVPATSRSRSIDAALWGATFLSAGLTLYLSLGPVPPGAGAFPNSDKVWHALFYAVTTFLFLLAAVWRPGRGAGPFPRAGLVGIAVILLAGGAVELLQGVMTEYREPELWDWIAELLGVTVALGMLALLRRLTEASA